MNDTQQKLDRAEQLIIQVLLNISKSTEILSNNLDEVNFLTCNNYGLLEPQELGIQVW